MPGKSGHIIFPASFDGELVTSIATNETLAYYGCTLADGNQLKVSLLYRHGVQDFTYENNYIDDYVMANDYLGKIYDHVDYFYYNALCRDLCFKHSLFKEKY